MPGGSFITGSAWCVNYILSTLSLLSATNQKSGGGENRGKNALSEECINTPTALPNRFQSVSRFKAVLSNKDPVCFVVVVVFYFICEEFSGSNRDYR